MFELKLVKKNLTNKLKRLCMCTNNSKDSEKLYSQKYDKLEIMKMEKDEKHYDTVNAIRYHFTQFNVWMAFFTTINGGLLLAYSNKDLNATLILLITFFGYIATILCCCLSKFYKLCITELSELIEKDFKKNKSEYSSFCRTLEKTKISTTIIVTMLAFALAWVWGVLLVSNICKGINYFITGIIVIITNIIIIFIIYNCLLCHLKKVFALRDQKAN